jgi:hypothetical protein
MDFKDSIKQLADKVGKLKVIIFTPNIKMLKS